MTPSEFLSAHHLSCGDCDRYDDEPPCEVCEEINASLARDLAALLSETRAEARRDVVTRALAAIERAYVFMANIGSWRPTNPQCRLSVSEETQAIEDAMTAFRALREEKPPERCKYCTDPKYATVPFCKCPPAEPPEEPR